MHKNQSNYFFKFLVISGLVFISALGSSLLRNNYVQAGEKSKNLRHFALLRAVTPPVGIDRSGSPWIKLKQDESVNADFDKADAEAAERSSKEDLISPVATIVVNDTTDTIHSPGCATTGTGTCSLRDAIIFTNTGTGAAGVTNTITLGAGTFVLNIPGTGETASAGNALIGDLDVLAPTNAGARTTLTIQGAGAGLTTIQQTTGIDRIFDIHPINSAGSVTFNLSDVTVTGGTVSSTSGGAIVSGRAGDITNLTNSVFTGNTASANGGAITQSSGGTTHDLTITNCTFTNNTATTAAGGAVNYSGLGQVMITNSTFSNNTAGTQGGAINITGNGTGATLTNILRSSFVNNTANGNTFGGAVVAVTNAVTTNINFNRIVGNNAPNVASGKIITTSGGTVTTVDASTNWWGINTGPAAGFVSGATVSNWLQLRNVASTGTLVTGQGTNLTADILGLSSGGSTSAANLVGLPSFPSTASAIFSNPIRGTLSATNGQFVNGIANLTPTFTATSVGAGSADATADSQTITANITINKASTTASIISDTPDPSNVGQNVTVAYSVSVTSPGGGTPTGNVQVSDGVNSCTGTVAAGNCVVALNTAGNRTLTATYLGDGANYNASPASAGAGHLVGTVTWTGATNSTFATNTNWNSGLAPGSADTVIIPMGASNQPTVGSATTVSSLSVASGRTLTVNSTLTVSGTLTNNGTIKGTGTIINNFTNGASGIVAPGLSPGILNITGNYTNAGAYNVEIGGTGGAGVNPNGHDQLLISGTATLGGTLNVTLTNGFTPAPGNTFTILDAASSTGTFGTTNLPNILPNTWNVAYNNANGTVILSVLAPVAAGVPISGRVATKNGTGISRARVSLTASNGTTRTVQTNAFGYYLFEDVEVGATYTVTVSSKRYTFAPRVIEVFDEISGLDFTPE